jgi:hypothetical protein
MAAWARRQGPRAQPAFDRIEIRKNLPPAWQVP